MGLMAWEGLYVFFTLCHCPLSSPNIDRFSRFFHWHILYTIRNNMVTKYPTAKLKFFEHSYFLCRKFSVGKFANSCPQIPTDRKLEANSCLSDPLTPWLIGTVRAEPETVISRAWVQSPDPAE